MSTVILRLLDLYENGRLLHMIQRFGKRYFLFMGCSFALGSIGYILLHSVMGRDIFAGLYRNLMYHNDHPYQYILVLAIAYGFVASLWAAFAPRLNTWTRRISILIVMVLSVVVASIPGGVLWVHHDMYAGYFPAFSRMIGYYKQGAGMGLMLGWLIVGMSLPYSALGVAVGYLVTDQIEKKTREEFMQ